MHTASRMHRHTDAMHTATVYTIPVPAVVTVGGIFALSFSCSVYGLASAFAQCFD